MQGRKVFISLIVITLIVCSLLLVLRNRLSINEYRSIKVVDSGYLTTARDVVPVDKDKVNSYHLLYVANRTGFIQHICLEFDVISEFHLHIQQDKQVIYLHTNSAATMSSTKNGSVVSRSSLPFSRNRQPGMQESSAEHFRADYERRTLLGRV